MSLLPSSQKDQLKVAAGLVAAALAGYYYMYPYTARADALAERLTNVETLEAANTKAKLQSRRGRAKELAEEALRLGAGLDAMQRLVPTVHEVPALLEEVSTAARQAGLELGGVSPEPVVSGREFDTYRYRVTLIGGYHALTTFLANVGSLPRIVAPVTFALAPVNGAPSRAVTAPRAGQRPATQSLEASVTIQTYVARTPADLARSASTGEAGGEIAGDGAETGR